MFMGFLTISCKSSVSAPALDELTSGICGINADDTSFALFTMTCALSVWSSFSSPVPWWAWPARRLEHKSCFLTTRTPSKNASSGEMTAKRKTTGIQGSFESDFSVPLAMLGPWVKDLKKVLRGTRGVWLFAYALKILCPRENGL